MPSITVVGLDPSMRNFGMVKGTLDLDTGKLSIASMQLSQPPKSNQKTVRKNSQDLEVAKYHTEYLEAFLEDVDLVFVEIPVGSQNARAMASYGMCVGILASIKKPLIQVTPAEVKIAATGNKTASKQDMISWAFEHYPNAPWIIKQRKGAKELVAKNEHLADSIAAIHAGVKTDIFKQMLIWFKNQ